MARIANIFARVVLELKEQAEGVLNQPDIPTQMQKECSQTDCITKKDTI